MKTILELSPEQLRSAAQIKEQIDSLQKRLQALIGQATATNHKPKGMSAAARAKISAAAKARWAKVKAGKPAANKPAKRKSMGAAQRAKIAAALKARWAKIHAEKAAAKK